MADKPPDDSYISVVDEEPEIFELLKWGSAPPQTQNETPINKVNSTVLDISESKSLRLREECDPFDLDDTNFIETYRLSKNLVKSLCQELVPLMSDSIKSIDVSIESKVLAALSFYASGKYQKWIGGKTDPGISQYFVSTAVLQVTEALNNPTIVKKYIHFPHLKNERDVIKNRFYAKYNMPGVIGCVDCTHVPIAKPEYDHKSHYNKSYHSKKVQIICDSDLNITSVDAAAGGACAHSSILEKHPVHIDLKCLGHSQEPCWLVGGAQYTQKPYLMTPIPRITKRSPISPEKHYADIHNHAHTTIIDTIKHVKSRWKCLQATCNKPFDPATVSMLVIACCILHNICNKNNMPVPQMTATEERLEAMKQKVANTPLSKKLRNFVDIEGDQARKRLVERLWNEKRNTPELASAPKKRSKKAKVQETSVQSQSNPVQQYEPCLQSFNAVNHMQPMSQGLDELAKRPRLVMANQSYGLGVASGWGHFPQP